jgi:ribose-phosphate pyrophosphokinase
VTTLATLPGSLKQLFERVDAAEASAEHLRKALDHWTGKRAEGVYPSPAAIAIIPEAIAHDFFVFERMPEREAGWRLRRAGEGARKLMLPADGSLLGFGNHEVALRLQRLFDWVAERGEPVSADFELDGRALPPVWCEVLAAPLSSDGKTVDAMFGGIVARPEAAGGKGR